MMSVDEDTELRDLIIQSLESNGILSKIKAELRASVFLALEEEGCLRDKIPLVNKKLCDFTATSEGKKSVSLIREFFQFFNMNFTLSVFEPEISDSNFLSREELCKEFNIQDDFNSPILLELLKSKNLDPTNRNKGFSHTFLKHTEEQSKEIKSDVLHGNRSLRAKSSFEDLVKYNDLKMKSSLHDPFYDEPLHHPPPSQRSMYTISHDDNQFENKSKKDESIVTEEVKSKDESLCYTLTNSKENSDRESNIFHDLKHTQVRNVGDDGLFSNEFKPREHKDILSYSMKADNTIERSLSSLRDLPALNIGAKGTIDVSFGKSQKKMLPAMESDFVRNKSIDDGEESAGSGHSAKSNYESLENNQNLGKYDVDSQENSEQSIEEEVDDDVSADIDDLLSSISVGDDTTNDVTISQISNAGGYDHIETVLPK